ncbi:MAG: sulfatase-like hydrolase/transferase [Planctomycetes bacterium]|nr:sulfatase-like hydrolase/transferase [Planctomycetota bacterium]
MHSKLNLLLVAFAAVAALTLGVFDSSAAERPNFVWILSEDSSVHYFRLYGHELGATPEIEKLAEEGTVFEHAFSCSPVCSVARTTLMSGMHAPRVGFQHHRKFRIAELPKGAELFPAYLREAGYYTTNNSKKDYNVEEGKVWDESSNKATWRDRPSPETPFFHMQTFTLSHESSLHFPPATMENERLTTDPADVELAPYHPDTPTFRFTKARYFDRIRAMDAEVGKLVARLEEDGLLDDTIIFYFGDHGGVLPRSKGYLYETGLRVPLVVRAPEKWREHVRIPPGRNAGFVSFVDFAPTVLRLAGVEVPETMDGRPFVGPGVSAEELAQRDEAYGYADRFDEKYDLCRSLRKGRYKYIRNYQAFYPDALHNNYRYIMLAYSEWRELHRQGKLNDVQSAFFEPKPVEMLFDLETDPHEVKNLAGNPAYAEVLQDLHSRLQTWVKRLPDLSFYPESYLIEEALPDGAEFGRTHKEEIARLIDTADLALLPFEQAAPRLESVLESENRWVQYWGLIACSCFGEEAKSLAPLAIELLDDSELMVRVRAAEFLAILGEADPAPTLREVLAAAENPLVSLLTLNTIVFLRDREPGYEFDADTLKIKASAQEIERRRDYLTGGARGKR